MKLELTPQQAVLVHYLVEWGITYELFSKYEMETVAYAIADALPRVNAGTNPPVGTQIDVTDALVAHIQQATRLTRDSLQARLLALTERYKLGKLDEAELKKESCTLVCECWDISASVAALLWNAADSATTTWATHMAKFLELCGTFHPVS